MTVNFPTTKSVEGKANGGAWSALYTSISTISAVSCVDPGISLDATTIGMFRGTPAVTVFEGDGDTDLDGEGEATQLPAAGGGEHEARVAVAKTKTRWRGRMAV